MNGRQFRRSKSLIRRLCANYDSGSCLLLEENFEPCPCPQLLTCSLLCKYFRTAVLPADADLYAEVMGISGALSAADPFLSEATGPYTVTAAPKWKGGGKTVTGYAAIGVRRNALGHPKPLICGRFQLWFGNARIILQHPFKTRF